MTWQNIATTSGSQDLSTKTGINQPLQRSPPAKSHHSTLSWHVCNFQKGSASPRPKSPNEWYGNQAQPWFAWLMRVCFQYNWWKQRYPWYPTQGWCFLMGYIKQASFRCYIPLQTGLLFTPFPGFLVSEVQMDGCMVGIFCQASQAICGKLFLELWWGHQEDPRAAVRRMSSPTSPHITSKVVTWFMCYTPRKGPIGG